MEGGVSSVVLLVRLDLMVTIQNMFVTDLHCQGISDAYYCAECTRLEKDRDGCPKIVNLGASRTDLFYERRRLGEHSLALLRSPLNKCVSRVQERLDSLLVILYKPSVYFDREAENSC